MVVIEVERGIEMELLVMLQHLPIQQHLLLLWVRDCAQGHHNQQPCSSSQHQAEMAEQQATVAMEGLREEAAVRSPKQLSSRSFQRSPAFYSQWRLQQEGAQLRRDGGLHQQDQHHPMPAYPQGRHHISVHRVLFHGPVQWVELLTDNGACPRQTGVRDQISYFCRYH